jgi:hypothetical protein
MTTPAQDRDQRAALSAPIAPSTSSAPRAARGAAGAELLPCPFCGHPEPTMMHDGPSLPSGYCSFWVWCEACNATGPEENTPTGSDAVAAWNRAPRPETAAEATRRRSHAVRDRRRLKAARRAGGGR